jgi:hypothetical protein
VEEEEASLHEQHAANNLVRATPDTEAFSLYIQQLRPRGREQSLNM